QLYNSDISDDDSISIDIQHTNDEEEDEPNEYDLNDDIDDEDVESDDDEEDEFDFDEDDIDDEENDIADQEDSSGNDIADEEDSSGNEDVEEEEEVVVNEEDNEELQGYDKLLLSENMLYQNKKKQKLNKPMLDEKNSAIELVENPPSRNNEAFKKGVLLPNLNIDSIPASLAHKVVNNFNKSTMVISHWKNDVHVTKSVHHVLGFPSGHLPVRTPDRVKSADECISKWRKQFLKSNFKTLEDGKCNEKKCHQEWDPDNPKSYNCGPLTLLTSADLLKNRETLEFRFMVNRINSFTTDKDEEALRNNLWRKKNCPRILWNKLVIKEMSLNSKKLMILEETSNLFDIIISPEQESVSLALFSMRKSPLDVLFQLDGSKGIARARFEYFYYNQWLYTEMIDIWCIILNVKERKTSALRQSRLFCDTFAAAYNIEDLAILKTKRYESFKEYIFVAAIIHNSSMSSLIDVHPVVKTPWRTTMNQTDCGIFLMRVMETYFGQKLDQLNTSFKIDAQEQKKQINILRQRYAAEILLSDINVMRDVVTKEADEFQRLSLADKEKLSQPKSSSCIRSRSNFYWKNCHK
ncbi:ulp1 protease family, C-terminal catalytic domain-containing protein, partial [Tanacetum coccineum]